MPARPRIALHLQKDRHREKDLDMDLESGDEVPTGSEEEKQNDGHANNKLAIIVDDDNNDDDDEVSSIIADVFREHRAKRHAFQMSPARRVGLMRKFKTYTHNIIAQNRIREHKRRKKQQERDDRIDLVCYCLFMLFFTLNTCDGLGDSSYYRFSAGLDATLGLSNFEGIKDAASLNSFLRTELVPRLYSQNFEGLGSANHPFGYDAEEGEGDEDEDEDDASYYGSLGAANGWLVQGPVRVGQLRSKTFDCGDAVPKPMNKFAFTCTRSRDMGFFGSSFQLEYESKDAFGHRPRNGNRDGNFTFEAEGVDSVAFQRTDTPYTTYVTKQGHSFPAPAFAVLLDPHGSRRAAQRQADRLASKRYIDRSTNAVFVDLSVYNYMLETTAWVRYTAEFNSAGGVDCSTEIQSYQLLWSPGRRAYKAFLSTAVAIGYLYLGVSLASKFYHLGYAQFESFYTYVQILNIAFFLVNSFYRYQSYSLLVDGLLAPSSIGKVDYASSSFLDLRPTITAMRYAVTFQSINTFLNWFKLVNFLAKDPTFGLMTNTLYFAASEMRAFIIVFLVVMFGFAQAHAMYFGSQLSSYRTILVSSYTLFRAMLGDFNFVEMYDVDAYIGPLFFVCFVGIAFLVVLNIIIAIIADAYMEANAGRTAWLERQKVLKANRGQTDGAVKHAFKKGVETMKAGVETVGRQASDAIAMGVGIARNTGGGGTTKASSWVLMGKGVAASKNELLKKQQQKRKERTPSAQQQVMVVGVRQNNRKVAPSVTP